MEIGAIQDCLNMVFNGYADEDKPYPSSSKAHDQLIALLVEINRLRAQVESLKKTLENERCRED